MRSPAQFPTGEFCDGTIRCPHLIIRVEKEDPPFRCLGFCQILKSDEQSRPLRIQACKDEDE